MKRLLFAFSLLTATCSVTLIQQATAQTTVTASAFTAKVNQLDGFIASGDTTSAKATFAELNTMMISVLGVSKTSIHNATTTSDKDYYTSLLSTQQVPLYQSIWQLKTNLVANRTTINAKLNQFDALIY